MAVNRGVVFTLMAIIISSVIVVSMQTLSSASDVKAQPELLRVQVVDGVTNSFLAYTEIALRTSTHAALTNLSRILAAQADPHMEVYFSSENVFVTGLKNCILDNATNINIKGSFIFLAPCTTSSYFPKLLNDYTSLVNDSLNVDITYAYDTATFSVTQVEPFAVEVTLNISVNVTDTLANWTITNHALSVRVPLTGVLDPVTAKFAQNSAYVTATFSPYVVKENRLAFSQITATSFVSMITNKEYRAAPGRAPSFLQRYYGEFNVSSACCGIESFIDGRQLNPGPWSVGGYSLLQNYSFTDHELLGNMDSGAFQPKTYASCSVVGAGVNAIDLVSGDTTAYFWMNATTLTQYGLTDDLIACP